MKYLGVTMITINMLFHNYHKALNFKEQTSREKIINTYFKRIADIKNN